MNRRLLASLVGLGLALKAVGAPIPLYYNYGSVTTPPQIDATAFLNAGTFNISTSLPFETQNTLYFTNRGIMSGSVGFRFNYASDQGRLPSSSFQNQQTIEADDNSSIFFSTTGLGFGGFLAGSYVLVSATNIVNTGTIGAGSGGIVRLAGNNLDLSYGGVFAAQPAVQAISSIFGSSIGLGYNGETNYVNPTGVSDLYWGAGIGNVLEGDPRPLQLDTAMFALPNPQSPVHQVVDTSGFTNDVSLPSYFTYAARSAMGTNVFTNLFNSFVAFAYTNQPSASNEVIQVAFIAQDPSDTNLNLQVRFAPGSGGDPNGKDVIVEFRMTDTDVISDLPMTNYIYFIDTSASDTNTPFLKQNLLTSTFRPSPFQVTLATPFEWQGSLPTNTAFNNSLLYDNTMVTNVATNSYSAYAAQVGQQQSAINPFNPVSISSSFGYQQVNPALTSPTNLPGRVELLGTGADLRSDRLDLTGTRLRSDGLLTLKTKHLVGSAQARIDAPLMSVDLGSTNQTLLISNLFPNAVKRLKGQLYAWSGVWTNQRTVVTTSVDQTSTNATITTNLVDVRFQVLMLDHSLQTVTPVAVNELIAHATNVILDDVIEIQHDIQINAANLSVQNQLSVPNALGSTNLPSLVNFTNQSTVYVPVQANLGADRPQPLNNFVNTGIMSGGGYHIRATNLFNGGLFALPIYATPATISAMNGAVVIESGLCQIENGQLTANSDVNLDTGDLIASSSTFKAGSISALSTNGAESVSPGTLFLTITNSIDDGGPGASNAWSCVGPFQLPVRPRHGDLLGTTITSTAPRFAVLQNIWAGEDRGAKPAGYTNNAALGMLVLDGHSFSRFVFSGPGTNNALYVDYLELLNYATNFTSALQIEPGMKIYFANANLPTEKLNGTLGGRLLWVSTYTGPNSSTNWTSPSGTVYTVNSALLNSEDIDSDLDGIVNRLDTTPFYTGDSAALRVRLMSDPSPAAALSWTALANAANALEFTTNLSAPTWQTLTNFVPSYPTHTVTVLDPLPADGQRYYRVRVLTSD
ncbi:MAG: hypothetical protein M1608_10150 [Candidatus Omnitrophica bacterium]|nr:hypothetical protein [Candidatus Omnitrophota bacterium]